MPITRDRLGRFSSNSGGKGKSTRQQKRAFNVGARTLNDRLKTAVSHAFFSRTAKLGETGTSKKAVKANQQRVNRMLGAYRVSKGLDKGPGFY